MDELRVILLVAGAIALAAVYYLSRPKKSRHPQSGHGRRRDAAPEDDEPEPAEEGTGWSAVTRNDPPPDALKRELRRLGDLISRERKPSASPAAAGDSGDDKAKRREKAGAAESEPDKIVVIYARARNDGEIGGRQLIDAAHKAGLEFGDMDIYHRVDEAGRREPIFSMADMVAPGTLDRAQSPGFTTPGVALFLRLPGPLAALDAWDAMLATARRLSELLDAELLDESLSTLNRQRVQQLREEMREYDRLATLEIRRS